MRNYLTETLADFLDDEHMKMTLQIDAFMHKVWQQRNRSPEYEVIMEKLERVAPTAHPSADLLLFLLLMEGMLEDAIRTEQVNEGGI